MMMRRDGRRLSEAEAGGEVLGPESVARALKARADERLRMRYMDHARVDAAGIRRWFALQVRGSCEFPVHNLLENERVEHWLPLKMGDARRRGCRPVASRKACPVPAFPGYLFVRIVADAEAIQAVEHLAGAVGLIRAGEAPKAVPDEIINRLRKMIDAGELDQTVAQRRLRKGNRVAIKDGPFAWMDGVMDGYVGSRHVRVLVEVMRRAVPVTLDLAQITKSD